MKRILIIFALLTTALLILAALLIKKPSEEKSFEIQGKKITVEIADTPNKRATGLMYRETLEKDKGMLFIFPIEGKHSFWMANTKIPLDMIWMDKDFEIVHVETNVPPCTEENIMKCPRYTPSAEAKYMLEVNAGWWDE